MLSNTVAVTAGKGGVLKTSLSCHLAGLAAAAGWRVLLVDADPQGNAMFDLGYRSDGGQNLFDALELRRPLQPLHGVRTGLDVAPGGPALDHVAPSSEPEAWFRLESALAPIADEYDLIVIDSPARELHIRRMILTAARCVIIPSGADRASRVGLSDAAATISEVRSTTNPTLDVLAVVAAPIASTHARIRARATARLGELIGDPDLVATTVVGAAPLVAEQCREHGLLVPEYAAQTGEGDSGWERSTISAAAHHVANDWNELVAELLHRLRALPVPL